MPKPFPVECRRDLIAVARKGEASIAQVARDVGIFESHLQRWRPRAAATDPRWRPSAGSHSPAPSARGSRLGATAGSRGCSCVRISGMDIVHSLTEPCARLGASGAPRRSRRIASAERRRERRYDGPLASALPASGSPGTPVPATSCAR